MIPAIVDHNKDIFVALETNLNWNRAILSGRVYVFSNAHARVSCKQACMLHAHYTLV